MALLFVLADIKMIVFVHISSVCRRFGMEGFLHGTRKERTNVPLQCFEVGMILMLMQYRHKLTF